MGFGLIILGYIILTFLRSVVIMLLFVTSSTNMHNAIVRKIIRTHIIFFDSNPIGRIFTRFSKDVSTLDLIMPGFFGLATFTIFRTITVFIMIMVIFPWMLLVVTFFSLFMFCVMKKAVSSQRECIRMDSIFRGPIHT